MAKVKYPLLSGDAQGDFAGQVIFTRGGNVRKYFRPGNPKTALQEAHRAWFRNKFMAKLSKNEADLLYAALVHLHDELYSALGHEHNALYSALGHNHNALYSALGHGHDQLQPVNGWITYSAVVPTRVAADDPTYTLRFAGVNLTSTLQESMPVRWTQNNVVRYGWISLAPSFSGGNTIVSVLTRTDSVDANYDVLDTATYPVSSFGYGLPRQPGVGFPALHEYWEVVYTSTANQVVTTPGTVIVNPGSMSQVIPIGDWFVKANFLVWVEFTGTNTRHSVYGGIGTANNTFDPLMMFYFLATSTSLIANGGYCIDQRKHFIQKTPLYINCQCGTITPATTAIRIRGDMVTTSLIARCAYLG